MTTNSNPASWLAPLGRLLLAWLFLEAGWSKILAPDMTAAFMATAGLPASSTLAFCVGVFELVAALLMAIGWHARTAAAALAAFTFFATVLYHSYWSAATEQQFVQQLGARLVGRASHHGWRVAGVDGVLYRSCSQVRVRWRAQGNAEGLRWLTCRVVHGRCAYLYCCHTRWDRDDACGRNWVECRAAVYAVGLCT